MLSDICHVLRLSEWLCSSSTSILVIPCCFKIDSSLMLLRPPVLVFCFVRKSCSLKGRSSKSARPSSIARHVVAGGWTMLKNLLNT